MCVWQKKDIKCTYLEVTTNYAFEGGFALGTNGETPKLQIH